MKKFVVTSSSHLADIENSVKLGQEMLKKTATFFGEDPNIPAADLLNIFNNFALAYEKAVSDRQREEVARKKRETAAGKFTFQKVTKSVKICEKDQGKRRSGLKNSKRQVEETKETLLDDVFGKLKSGKAFASRKEGTLAKSRNIKK
eukprot:TRINITY_DN2046_c0_g1_i1.p1 TRINITY_DN2046_c0_g1~~TRINITY_DN2046_c0_g1_i1.p1  ORF type:complete len:147 (+),score=43.19 TRINITY_DN2046_c0_g1_i1:530-970(+)